MPNKPIIRSRRKINDTGIFHIEEIDLEFDNGNTRRYQRLLGSPQGAVMVVPLLDHETLLLIREYCAGMDQYELGFVKGRIENGEEPLDAAVREMQEETGYAAKRLEWVKSVTLAPGYLFHQTHIVLARDLYPKPLPGDEPEPIEVVPWKLDQLDSLLKRDDFTEARSIVAFHLVRELLASENRK
ncbi:MAG: ADP compounds hydrolase NudE [Gammaproteobacteria bacterium]|nr:ADP compounds hydrolase NudE [Gammaproteobacteria bacterium]